EGMQEKSQGTQRKKEITQGKKNITRRKKRNTMRKMKRKKITSEKMNEFPSKDVLPLKFLYIDENNQCTVKSTNEPLNLFYELYGYEPVSFLYTPYITQVNINNVREKALKHAR